MCMCEIFHSFHTERCDAGAKILPKPQGRRREKSSQQQTKRARSQQPTKLSKYDSGDCIDIDRLQCGFSAYGKQFQSAAAATAAIEKYHRHRLYAILLRVRDF